MIRMVNIAFLRALTIYLIVSLFVIAAIPARATAMFITPGNSGSAIDSIADMEKVNIFLEAKIVQQRLTEFGLTSEEISSRLNQLSPAQLHKIATNIDNLDYGGDDGIGIVISILIIVILIIVVLKLMNRQIIIK